MPVCACIVCLSLCTNTYYVVYLLSIFLCVRTYLTLFIRCLSTQQSSYCNSLTPPPSRPAPSLLPPLPTPVPPPNPARSARAGESSPGWFGPLLLPARCRARVLRPAVALLVPVMLRGRLPSPTILALTLLPFDLAPRWDLGVAVGDGPLISYRLRRSLARHSLRPPLNLLGVEAPAGREGGDVGWGWTDSNVSFHSGPRSA